MPPASSRVRGNGLAGLLFENVDAAADARPFAHHRGLGAEKNGRRSERPCERLALRRAKGESVSQDNSMRTSPEAGLEPVTFPSGMV